MNNYLNHLIACLFAASALLAIPSIQANDAANGKEAVILLQQRTLLDAPGKKVIVAIVNYAPGQASFGHAHPGSVVAYVLEGAVVSQVEGEQPVTYKTGDSWYESPRIPHVVSRNASKTESAKLLVWMLSNEGEGIKVPVDK